MIVRWLSGKTLLKLRMLCRVSVLTVLRYLLVSVRVEGVDTCWCVPNVSSSGSSALLNHVVSVMDKID